MGITWVADVLSWAGNFDKRTKTLSLAYNCLLKQIFLFNYIFPVGGPDYFWYVTDLINALQGVPIFIVVGCQPQVKIYWFYFYVFLLDMILFTRYKIWWFGCKVCTDSQWVVREMICIRMSRRLSLFGNNFYFSRFHNLINWRWNPRFYSSPHACWISNYLIGLHEKLEWTLRY